MYHLIGADGHEYGPVSADVLKQWIAEGRANAETKVRSEGSTEWKQMGEFADFAESLRMRYGPPPAAPSIPPPAGDGAAAPQQSPPSQTLPGLPSAPSAPALGPVPSAPRTSRDTALALVRPPAIFILVVAGFGLLGELSGLAFQSLPFPLPPEFHAQRGIHFLLSLPGIMMGLAFNGLAVFGAISMLSLKRWGFCIAGAVALIVPCSGCCCCLGLISGIWALVVLNKPEVRSVFTS